MVSYIDRIGDAILRPRARRGQRMGREDRQQDRPVDDAALSPLGLPEFATIARVDHYNFVSGRRSEISSSSAPIRASTSRSLCPILKSSIA